MSEITNIIGQRNFYENLLRPEMSETVLSQSLTIPDGPSYEAGTPFSAEILEQVSDEQLAAGDLALESKEPFSRISFIKDFNQIVSEFPEATDINKYMKLLPATDRLLGSIRWTRDLIVHMQLMQRVFPQLYTQSILGAWIATVAAVQLRHPQDIKVAVFQGSLFRDLGMLYVHRSIVLRKKTSTLSIYERAAVQQHVEFTKAVLNRVGGIDSSIIDAATMHHQRTDASGYPRIQWRNGLPSHIAIPCLADVVAAVRTQRYSNHHHTIREVVDIILLEQDAYDTESYEALRDVTKQFLSQTEKPVEHEDVRRVLSRAREIDGETKALLDALDQPKVIKRRLTRTEAYKSAQRMLKSLRRSGHGNPELTWWLSVVVAGKDKIDNDELVQIEIQQEEILNQLRKIQNAVRETLSVDG